MTKSSFNLFYCVRWFLLLMCFFLSETLLAESPSPPVKPFDHSLWDTLLKAHVYPVREGQATEVDYTALKSNRGALKDYLNALSRIKPSEFFQWQEADRLAFLINAYNASTVDLILTKYPELDSIKDLGTFFWTPWKRDFVSLLGETRSLDNIEHQLIRQNFEEPRIHFAVNCASIGCPALWPEAYIGSRLESQLEAAASNFLRDASRNRIEGFGITVSSIFKWYRSDFEEGWQGAYSLHQFLARYADALSLTPMQKQRLENEEMSIRFGRYNWKLNDHR